MHLGAFGTGSHVVRSALSWPVLLPLVANHKVLTFSETESNPDWHHWEASGLWQEEE